MDTDLNIVLRVKELRDEASEYRSIVFERPRGLTFAAGDWLDICFPVPAFPVGKTYSFASAPTEPDLMISFRKGLSPFKKALENVQPGETMLITQYGSNGFLFDRSYPAVFIGGGIGIAPLRRSKGIQMELERNGIERLTTLRYYIAGSPQMVHNCEHHLCDLGIEKNSIKTDSFEGY